jgi:phytoene dehydrogenase-like protein
MTEHEVVVIGAGHNGLTLAGYLAKAGVDVGVVESRAFIGGGAQTRENTVPGFKQETDAVLHLFVQANPMIRNDELDLLSRYGLEYIKPAVTFANVFPDDAWISCYHDVDKTCESIERISPRDAAVYRDFVDMALSILNTMTPGFFSPPPGLGQTMAMLETSSEGQEIERALLMSASDIIDEWFTDEHVKIALLKMANEGLMFPEAKGTGLNAILCCSMLHQFHGGTPRGGGIELPNSLRRSIEDRGGKVYTDAEVVKITRSPSGQADGVILASGDRIGAKRAVVSSLHVRFLAQGLVDGFPEDLSKKLLRANDSSHSTFTSNYALREAPHYRSPGAEDALMVELLPMMEGFRQHYEDCRLGIPPRQPVPYIACHTLFDDSKAPAGQHAIQLFDPAPYNLAEGGPQRWDEIREEHEDRKLAWVRELTTNMGDENILGRDIMSPLDLERYCTTYWRGDIVGLGSDLYQFLGARPIPALGRYRTPIDGLYIAGPTTHPGGGVIGGGRAAVQVVMEDLGIDFESVVD